MLPQTTFETTGDWTSLADEIAFLQHIASETSATYEVAGKSFEERDLPCLIVGSGPRAVVCVGLVHGDEPAGREMLLTKARDLAYTQDSSLLAYLGAHTVVFLPTCNPDRHLISRNTAQGVNINRDHLALESPEARAIASYLHDYQPHLVIDAHERHGDNQNNWHRTEIRAFHSPNAHDLVNARAHQMYVATGDHLSAQAYTWSQYSYNHRRWLNAVGALRHSVGLLIETWLNNPDRQHRVAMQRAAFEGVLGWHMTHSNALAADLAFARAATAAPGYYSSFLLQTGNQDVGAGTVLNPVPASYAFEPGALGAATLHLDLFGIEVEGDTISMAQEAAPVIPYLFDEESSDVVMAGERVLPQEPEGWTRRRATGSGWAEEVVYRPSAEGWVSIRPHPIS